MGPPLGASPPKRMTASWPGALAGSTECKVAARLLRPLRGSPRFVRDTRLSNPAEHSPPPPLWISGPPPPDSWRSLWRATYPQLPPLSICSRKGSHLEQSPLTENSPCKAQDEVDLLWQEEKRLTLSARASAQSECAAPSFSPSPPKGGEGWGEGAARPREIGKTSESELAHVPGHVAAFPQAFPLVWRRAVLYIARCGGRQLPEGRLPGRAGVAELADAPDLGSGDASPWG